ncbi:MAG: right-handed parallel beta-helix repeat-containing protein [Candidatus Eisenbacteria bacterium]
MNRVLIPLTILGSIVLIAPSAGALTVTVPDNYSTIQAAHDAGATVIQVRDGIFPGSVVITHDCSIIPYPTVSGQFAAAPWIQGSISVNPPIGISVLVRGMRVSGRATTGGGSSSLITFEGCRLDSGLVVARFSNCAVRYNMITSLGITAVGPWAADIVGNTVVGGIYAEQSEAGVRIQNNFVLGPAPVGIYAHDVDGDASVHQDIVTGATRGIDFDAGGFARTTDYNQVSNCSGDGIVAHGYIGNAVVDNIVTNCSGRGIVASSSSMPSGNGKSIVRRNVVSATGSHGIEIDADHGAVTDNTVLDAHGAGIIATPGAIADSLVDNLVLRANGAGCDLASASVLQFNTIGRCGGDGVHIDATPAGASLAQNTVYLNAGDGYDLSSATVSTLTRNIAYGSSQYGLRASGGVPVLSCNDWFGNTSGATLGVSPGGSDLSANPLFCNLPADIVALSAGSPLASGPCAVVGSKTVGCASATDVTSSISVPARLGAHPVPTQGNVEFRLPHRAEAGTLQVFDATGALRWRANVSESGDSWVWDLRDLSGRVVPNGVYYARLTAGTQSWSVPVTVIR